MALKLIDIHTHIPNVDDGAKSFDEALNDFKMLMME